MQLCTISIPHVKASTSRVLASLGSFVHGAQEDDGANQERQPVFQSYERCQPMGKQEFNSIGIPHALLLAGLEERERVLRVEEEDMETFFYLQETLVFDNTAAPIQGRDPRRRLTSSFPDKSSPSFPSGSTTTRVPFSPPTIILEPMSSAKGDCSGDHHRVPVWTSSSEFGHDISEGSYELPGTNLGRSLRMKLASFGRRPRRDERLARKLFIGLHSRFASCSSV